MIRKEIHTRSRFSQLEAIKWFNKIKHNVDNGNIFTCKATKKFLQARKIYIHYTNEYQTIQCLKQTK